MVPLRDRTQVRPALIAAVGASSIVIERNIPVFDAERAAGSPASDREEALLASGIIIEVLPILATRKKSHHLGGPLATELDVALAVAISPAVNDARVDPVTHDEIFVSVMETVAGYGATIASPHTGFRPAEETGKLVETEDGLIVQIINFTCGVVQKTNPPLQ